MGIQADLDRPMRNRDNAYRPVDDEGGLVVLPIRSEVKVLNPVASKIYAMLDGSHTRGEIVAAVVKEFDVTEQQATQDLQQFLEELEREGMLAGANGSSDPEE